MPKGDPGEVTIVQFSDSGQRLQKVRVPKVVKSDDEWRKQLSPGEFDITRHADTEIAFSGKYWNLHDKGLYRCICCDNALFSSDTKFESGTGWPSFWQPIAAENVRTISDTSYGMVEERGCLYLVRRAPGARLRRRAAAYRASLLHEFGFVEIREAN